jgi:hypothetical protein
LSTECFYNVQLTASATKNNCGGGQVGSSVVMTATANSFVSQISQADANAQANNYLTSNVQAYANNLGTCTVTADTTPLTMSQMLLQYVLLHRYTLTVQLIM